MNNNSLTKIVLGCIAYELVRDGALNCLEIQNNQKSDRT